MLRSFFFKMNRVLSVTVVVRVLLRLIVDFGVGKYLRNSCHLAAKIGTNSAIFVLEVVFVLDG
jgi:hypothetical protein